MRHTRTSSPPVAVVLALLTAAAVAGDVPWKERHELTISPGPGVATDPERYTKAEVIWFRGPDSSTPAVPARRPSSAPSKSSPGTMSASQSYRDKGA